MEDPCKHEKKNVRTMPVAINIGAGAGIGGIVLFGGSLVTATLVAVNRRRRRSSSEIINKSRSPSPETQTVDAPNQLESLAFNLQKPSNGEETGMKEIEINDIQDLTLDEKHNSVIDVSEQENKTICVDSVSEVDNGYKKIVLDCEEQVVMSADIESGPPSSDDDSVSEIMERDDNGEEQKNSMLIHNANDEHVEKKSLISDEAFKSIEEHEANEVGVRLEKNMTTDISQEAAQDHAPLEDDKLPIEDDKMPIEVDKMPIEHVVEAKETVFVNKEAASGNHVDAEDSPQLKYHEMEAIQEEIKVSVDDDDQRTVKEDNPPTQLMNKAHNDAEEKITEDEKAASVNHVDAEDNPQLQVPEKEEIQKEIKVYVDDDELHEQRTVKEDNPPTQLMKKEEHKDEEEKITENEMIKKDEIQSIEEDEDSEKDGRSKTEISSDVEDSSTEEQTQEAKINSQKNQEQMQENQTNVIKTNQQKKQRSVTRRLKNTWRKIRQL